MSDTIRVPRKTLQELKKELAAVARKLKELST